MANEFIARKGLIALEDSQISGSLSVTGDITGSIFSGSFIGDGSQLSGIEGFPFTGSAGITGSLTVVGPVNATTFTGDGSQLTGIEGFPFTGSAKITGSLEVTGSVTATSFTGSIQGTATSASYVQLANIDGFTAYSASVNTAIDSVLDATTPLTATVNTTNSPFTVTSQSIVIIDSTNGDVTVNLPDLDTINGTPDQKPILLYKNDYSQNVVYVQPSGSQLVNGTTQDLIVSLQIGIVYNPTSAGWVTEGTSYQSLAELELFFVPRTETGSLSVATASYVEYSNVANKPALVSGSEQITYSGLTGIPSGIVSGSAQITDFGIFATTGSNGFNGDQSITGSLTVTGQVVAQTLNVQQVTSSVVYSSGSNIFGNDLGNTQQFTGSMLVTGSLTVAGAGTFTTSITPLILKSTNATTMWTEYYYNTSTLSGYIGSGGGILSGANTSDFIIRSEADFVVATGGNNRRLTIASTGNLGLGVTPSAWDATGAGGPIIQIGRGLLFGADTETRYIFNAYYGTGNFRYIASSIAASNYQQAAGEHRWYNAPSGTAGNTISFIQAMTLDASGRLGIGTTSPASRLNVAGAKTNSADLSNAANQLVVTDTTATAAGVGGRISFFGAYTATPDYITLGAIEVLKDNANNYGSASWNNAAMRFIVGNNDNDANAGRMLERMRITSGGNVGIGTNSPNIYNLTNTRNLTLVNDGGYGVIAAVGSSGNGGEIDLGNSSIRHAAIASLDGSNLGFYTNGSNSGTGVSQRMLITSGGDVLIGTATSSGDILTIAGNINLTSGTNRRIYIGSASNYYYRIRTDGDDFVISEAAVSDRLRYSYGNTRWEITGGLSISGALSKGSGSFKIDHPLPSKKDTHHLVHSFIEGPQADNIYRGKIQLVNGKATVNLDQSARMTEGTFVLLNGNIQCFTSNESGWTAVKGIVAENILTIEAQYPECADTISWLVVGERIDQHMLDTDWTDENGKVITEPLKQ